MSTSKLLFDFQHRTESLGRRHIEGSGSVIHSLKSSLHGGLDIAPKINLTARFSSLIESVELPRKISPYVMIEWKYTKSRLVEVGPTFQSMEWGRATSAQLALLSLGRSLYVLLPSHPRVHLDIEKTCKRYNIEMLIEVKFKVNIFYELGFVWI